MEEHKHILEQLVKNEFPKGVSEKSFPSIAIFKELYDSGCITAHDASSDDGLAYLEPKITLLGREYLSKLNHSHGVLPTSINNSIHINAPFTGNLQSGQGNLADFNSQSRPEKKSPLNWLLDNIIAAVIVSVLTAVILGYLELKSA